LTNSKDQALEALRNNDLMPLRFGKQELSLIQETSLCTGFL
jgi:hypothetical protein